MKKIICTSLLFAVAALCAFCQPETALGTDPDVRIGVLDNGLTYYIRANNWPENRANFYIVQRVGSLEEEDNQRGLAHFLEHICFNGTDNFPGNDVIEYCRSIGVEFGRDLNAYTSVEETVYNIDNVPTYREASLDSCLLILRDWADGLTLDPVEIDKERGVIHEEWRLRSGAMNRMVERNLPALYPGSKYGYRMPIGTMEVVDNFRPEELRAYYEKWYHPANQGIIVVGNVDVDRTEAKIKEMFGAMTNPENAAPIVKESVPDNSEPIVVIDQDKEQTTCFLNIYMKHEAYPDSLKNTSDYVFTRYLIDAATAMLGNRYYEAMLDADCPYVDAYSIDGPYLLSKAVDALDITVSPKDISHTAEALTAAYTEARRAAEYGFTDTEYARFKADFLSGLDREYSNKDKRTNHEFYRECKAHFLDGEPMMSIDERYAMYQQIVPMIPVQAVNMLVKDLINETDTNLVIINFNNEKDGAVYPTREELLGALQAAREAEITPFVDNVKDEPLVSDLPAPGEITNEETNEQFDYTELTLSNGVSVVLKHTDFEPDKVIISGEGGAGKTAYEADDVNLKLFDDVIGYSGLGGFTQNELMKAMAGKIANADLTMNERKTGISGSSTPRDAETMLQMVYLYFTAITKDTASYDNLMSRLEAQLKNRDLNPDIAFSDSLSATLYGHDPRRAPLTADDLPLISYDRILEMARAATRSANGWEFTIAGNYDEETIRPLICQYLGALPSSDVIESSPRRTDYVKGNVTNIFNRRQETPQATAAIMWVNEELPYSWEHKVQMDMIGQVLEMEYLQKIREDASAAYTCSATGMASVGDDGWHAYVLQAYCPMKPEKKETAMEIMAGEVLAATKSIDGEKLQKVKEAMLKKYDDNQNKNAYWDNVIYMWRKFGVDIQTGGRELIESQTAESLTALMKEFLAPGNCITVAMFPEESEE
ncbi:MAG: insulinase family protein [Prevotella sp.]|nr:insulinase family protein [Prevotella sp.]